MLVDIRPGLRNHLLTDASIAAMVSTRIYPVRNAEGNRSDCIVFVRVLENESYNFTGRTGLVGARFQIDAWSQSTDRVNHLADLVKERLSGYSGIWSYGGSSPNDFVTVQGAFLTTAFEDYSEEAQMYRLSRDFMIWYKDQP